MAKYCIVNLYFQVATLSNSFMLAKICLIFVWHTMEGGIGGREGGLAGALLELIELTHTVG